MILLFYCKICIFSSKFCSRVPNLQFYKQIWQEKCPPSKRERTCRTQKCIFRWFRPFDMAQGPQAQPPWNLFQVNHTLVVVCWWHKSHQLHQCAWPRRNSQTTVQFQFIFTFVFWVINNTRNWVQRVGCFWLWLSRSIFCY